MNRDTFRRYLQSLDLNGLFIEELGWDNTNAPELPVSVGEETFCLQPIAQKREFTVFHCETEQIPDYATRRKLENRLKKRTQEHFILFTDEARTQLRLQYLIREPGKPEALRERRYFTGQDPEAMLQLLSELTFSLEEEEHLGITDVKARASKALQAESLTKKFYQVFKQQHKAFLGFIQGIEEQTDQEWYASLMLNRLMFIYFIQKKGFLDQDRDYLRNKLREVQAQRGEGEFFSFYRSFLLVLFHQGLGAPDNHPIELGNIPYLNGGLFDVHEMERKYAAIEIPDAAFERIFDFFDQYEWHLDTRQQAQGNHINPDVIGYIFEKYINDRAGMGAYYTQEDITEYITKNCVIPYLFEQVQRDPKVKANQFAAIWRLPQQDPDRYIYPAVKHGVALPLPDEIAAGLNHIPSRGPWNRPAPAEYGLPTEIWREVVARRQRYEAVKQKLAEGEVQQIQDFITYNLNIRQLAEDVLAESDDPALVQAFHQALADIRILDPTCGSGAFLFAALEILEPLYRTSLQRMRAFVEDLPADAHPEKFRYFKEQLAQLDGRNSETYHIYKRIILHNLYGVDLMKEAVEIAKLRLFLKLAGEAQADPSRPNMGLEPLPDLDFNLRAGNTLVGFATLPSFFESFDRRGVMDFDNAKGKVQEAAELVSKAFQKFQDDQLRQDERHSDSYHQAKEQLQARLTTLNEELNRHLAQDYGVDLTKKGRYPAWLASHQPFHWFAEFYEIVHARGGFDVVVGNPPYVVYAPNKVAYSIDLMGYETISTKNLYGFVFERAVSISNPNSLIGLIVQLTILASDKMTSIQGILRRRGDLLALPFPRRPESIFDGVEMPVSIMISVPSIEPAPRLITSTVRRFYTDERPIAMERSFFSSKGVLLDGYRISKISHDFERNVFEKLTVPRGKVENLTARGGKFVVYYQEACRYWVKASPEVPYFKKNGEQMTPSHGRILAFAKSEHSSFVSCLLNSSIFYWMYSLFSDCEHVNDKFVRGFSIPDNLNFSAYDQAISILMTDMEKYASQKVINTKQGHQIEYSEIKASNSKPLIDEIDRVLAGHYGLTEEELDYIINYDIKYRMGKELPGYAARQYAGWGAT